MATRGAKTQRAATADGPSSAAVAVQKQAAGRDRMAREVRAVVLRPDVIKKAVAAAGQSKADPIDDPFATLIRESRIVEPPFDPLVLAQLVEYSSELGPCVDAMEVNCDAYGFALRPLPALTSNVAPVSEETLKLARSERLRLRNFFRNCYDTGFTALRRLMRHDLETTGNAFWEVARNAAGDVDQFFHIPAYQMRLSTQDRELVEYEQVIAVESEKAEGVWTIERRRAARRFRRFVQWRPGSPRLVWFKEFGDPRDIDRETGEFFPKGKIPEQRRGNEMLHWKLYSPRTPYGLPRYIGNLLSIYGSRGAEEINFVTFRNNNVPSMFVMVSDGFLTDASVERLKKLIETQVRGSDNYSKIVILEAESDPDNLDDARGGRPHPKIEVKPLSDSQIRDAMFIEYDKANRDKVRRSFRLPPLFLGGTEDMNRATADASMKLAERQVFAPERSSFDAVVNMRLMPVLGVRFHDFRSNGPPISANEDLVQVMGAAERSGGLTPRISRELVEEISGREFGEIDPAKLDPDTPFSLTMAREVKNLGPVTQGQVTALKRLDSLSFLEALAVARSSLEDEVRWRWENPSLDRAA